MNWTARAVIGTACLLISVLTQTALAQGKQSAAAPIPNQITGAKKVFITNAGGDEPSPDEPMFSGGIDRSYNQFYAGIKSSGRFEIVDSPAEADLLLEIRFSVLPAPQTVFKGDTINKTYDPQFRLEIRDPKTNALLWGFTEHMEWAILQGNRNKNFDKASARTVTDVIGLAARVPSGAPEAKQ